MSANQAFRFTASDDSAFQQLLGAHVLRAGNPLADIPPSALDLTANCWTTLDLQHLTYDASGVDELTRLGYLANAVRPILPPSTAGGIINLNEYWHAIVQLESSEATVGAAIHACRASDGFTLPDLDFGANCSATLDFWWHNILNAAFTRPPTPGPSWISLFRSSLVGPLHNVSDSTLQAMIRSVRQGSFNEAGRLPDMYLIGLFAALPACRALQYTGSSQVTIPTDDPASRERATTSA